MTKNNTPCENEENLTVMDLIGNVFSLVEAAHEQDTSKAKAGLERCVDPDAECYGCPYEGKEDGLLRCFDKLMEDALRLIGALEVLCMRQSETIVALCGKSPEGEKNDENA